MCLLRQHGVDTKFPPVLLRAPSATTLKEWVCPCSYQLKAILSKGHRKIPPKTFRRLWIKKKKIFKLVERWRVSCIGEFKPSISHLVQSVSNASTSQEKVEPQHPLQVPPRYYTSYTSTSTKMRPSDLCPPTVLERSSAQPSLEVARLAD